MSAQRVSIGVFSLPLNGFGAVAGRVAAPEPGDGAGNVDYSAAGSDNRQALIIARGLPWCDKTTQARRWVTHGGQAGRRLRARVLGAELIRQIAGRASASWERPS